MAAESRMKNIAFSRPVGRPMVRACVSSKKVTIRSFHRAVSSASATKPMIASCSVSPGLIARMLPIVMQSHRSTPG